MGAWFLHKYFEKTRITDFLSISEKLKFQHYFPFLNIGFRDGEKNGKEVIHLILK